MNQRLEGAHSWIRALAIMFTARGIWLLIAWMNRRDDPRHWKRPPDPP